MRIVGLAGAIVGIFIAILLILFIICATIINRYK